MTDFGEALQKSIQNLRDAGKAMSSDAQALADLSQDTLTGFRVVVAIGQRAIAEYPQLIDMEPEAAADLLRFSLKPIHNSSD